MNRVNYNTEMVKILGDGKSSKKVLLHSCCAPCSSACIERLKDKADVTVFYYNPNIDTSSEYAKRANEQKKLCKELSINYIDGEYDQKEFFDAVTGFETFPEGGLRCGICFRLRLNKTAETAKQLGFDFFATTLTLSPLKNAQLINEIGFEVAEQKGIKYLPSDFKKGGGYLRSIELSKEHSLYRQNYCGCIFSKKERGLTD